MNSIQHACALLAGALLGGCAEEADLQTEEQAVLWWHDHSEVTSSGDAYRGAPAWANDGGDAAGLELHYQRKLSVPPLQGWWEKRNFSFRPFLQNPAGGAKRFLGSARIAGQPTSLEYMHSAGYLLITRFVPDAGAIDIVRVGLDGSVKTAVSTPIGDDRHVVPSPDGRKIADVRCKTYTEVDDGSGVIMLEPLDPALCTVTFLDAATLAPSGAPATGQLAWPTGGDPPMTAARWTPQGKLVVQAQSAAFTLAPGGAVTKIAVPACQGPLTSSSKIGSDGRRIGVSRGQLRTVAADPSATDRFGCP